MRNKIHSDGLGGFHGVSQTSSLGAEKRLRYNKFYIFLILMILTIFYNMHMYEIACFSFNLTMQSNIESISTSNSINIIVEQVHTNSKHTVY